ncbi:MAG: glycosyltransferase family 4 protein [Nitrospirae bacterium]|nr:glycosyltransferase family 4 protein [Nitrospirota bacterium]MBF0535079.1 glycosyltransferase family 4 protein [Nitrospirota bacterium]MBF0615371.1 glycosyltransferase family 4 protein [Nitrospirota bacterium]
MAKIAIYNLTTTTKAGGVETFVWGIARGLATLGHEVHIYGGKSNDNFPETDGVTVFTYPYLNRELIPFVGSRLRKFIERLSFAFFAISPLIKRSYDIIYIHKSFDLPAALYIRLRTGARVFFHSHGTEFFPGFGSLVRRVDKFFSCSQFNAASVEKRTGINPVVIYNGVDTDFFKPSEPDENFVKQYCSHGEKILITVCRLVGWKGVQYAIAALPEILTKHRVKYLIIGDGEFRKSLERKAQDLKVDGDVVFLGKIANKDMPLYYHLASVAVYPSVADETFGISIAEAMSCGVPVVATRVGGIPEVLSDDAGVLIPPRDEHALGSAVNALLSDSSLAASTGKNGRQRCLDNFSWNTVTDRFDKEAQISG